MDNPFKDLHLHLQHKENGDLVWISKGFGRKQFSVAGGISYNYQGIPYIRVRYNLVKYQATHLIIYLNNGTIIKKDDVVDHIDGNPLNNKIENLRVCSQSVNNKNKSMQKNNSSGITGVNYCRHNLKFIMTIGRDVRFTFDNLLDACAKRKSLEIKLGYTKRHGK